MANRRTGLWTTVIAAGIAASIAVLMVNARRDASAPNQSDDSAAILASGDSTLSLIATVDSANAYEHEAQVLLNKLELQRAMIRPEALAAAERDLKVVDVAISELKEAVARNPRDRALRQLLASSYRQKVDLLKRANNAG